MINDTVLAGTGEIGQHFAVRTNVVCNWVARYDDFPDPVADLSIGKVWDLNEVVVWFNDRWATDVDDSSAVAHA